CGSGSARRETRAVQEEGGMSAWLTKLCSISALACYWFAPPILGNIECDDWRDCSAAVSAPVSALCGRRGRAFRSRHCPCSSSRHRGQRHRQTSCGTYCC